MASVEDEFGELYGDLDEIRIQIQAPATASDDDSERREESIKEEEEVISESESESEDDLHIVLNDDDARVKLKHLKDENDDDEDLVFPNDGAELSSERYSHHSQYKYIRSHAPAFLSPTTEWDGNACNQQPLKPLNGRDFSLPRHRTILDVNIDTFDHKPWNHPGIDITDFFNFGFHEQTWKHYCNTLEQYRHQSVVARINQVYGAGSGHRIVSPETVGGELAQIGQGGGVSSNFNDAMRGEGRLDIPKGRAIQVDGGIGERLPSMDARHPQNRDSDVVIQIPVLDNMDCSFTSSKQVLGHSDNSKLSVSESGGSGGLDVTQNAVAVMKIWQLA